MTINTFVFLSYIRRGESHWWMKGSTPPQIAEIIIKLVKDMAAVSRISSAFHSSLDLIK